MSRWAALAAVLLTAPLLAEPWTPRAESADADALAAAYPDSAAMLRRQIGAQIAAGKDAAARAGLVRLAAMGFAMSPAGQQQVAELLDPAVRARFAANAAPLGSPQVAATIPAGFGLVESAVEVRGLKVASSITGQDLLVSRDGKAWRPLRLAGLGSLGALAVDRRRGLVWAASGLFEQTPRPAGAFSGLVLVDPRQGKVVRRIAAPEGVTPGDIALAADGTLYASDPLGGGLWRARGDQAVLAPLVPAGTLRSPQGIAPAADGRRLYVSDYGAGIAIVDTASGAVTRLAGTGAMMLDGIDGLLRHGDDLIALQNGTRPLRVVALRLSADGTRVTALRELLRRLPGDGEPTTGEVRNGKLRYVGNARWDLYGKGGALPAGASPAPTRIEVLILPK